MHTNLTSPLSEIASIIASEVNAVSVVPCTFSVLPYQSVGFDGLASAGSVYVGYLSTYAGGAVNIYPPFPPKYDGYSYTGGYVSLSEFAPSGISVFLALTSQASSNINFVGYRIHAPSTVANLLGIANGG